MNDASQCRPPGPGWSSPEELLISLPDFSEALSRELVYAALPSWGVLRASLRIQPSVSLSTPGRQC